MKDSPGILAVVFDMDGVLTDSEPLIRAAAMSMFLEKGLRVRPEDFLPFVGTGENRHILAAAERLKIPANRCVVVKDAVHGVHGVEAALAAGMRCVAVAQTFPAEMLRAAHRVRAGIGGVTVADLLG